MQTYRLLYGVEKRYSLVSEILFETFLKKFSWKID